METVKGERVHNVGILGHSGAGKTMLIEHILHIAGETNRMGSIAEGNTVGDYLEDEIAHGHTIAMKLMHFKWHGMRIHVVDHPGYMDFIGEVASSTPMLDALIIMVDATTGIQVGTDIAMKYAYKYKIPRAIFVNKLDRENTDFSEIANALKETYGKQCVPLVIPVGSGATLERAVNIIDDDTSEFADQIAVMKEGMADAIAETNDDLLEHYLETGELSAEQFQEGLHDGIRAGKIVPILGGSVEKDIGVRRLMDIISDSFPAPSERKVSYEDGTPLEISPDAPFVGQVFRSIVDPFVGHLSLFRVFSGTLKADTEFYNVSTQTKERTGKIFMLNGKNQVQVPEVGPGDLAAMTKLKHTHFGDTIATNGIDKTLPRLELPESMVKLAIEPKSRADEDKIGEALHRLSEEDPTFGHYRDEATGEHIIKCMGDLQMTILLDRLKNKYHVEADTNTPKVAYKETIRGKSDVQGKHKKQTGGHGQYGDVHIRFFPSPRGEGYKFIDSIVGGVVPRQYIAHVDKGIQDALLKGDLSGNPVVDVTAELHFGSYHNVDSSEMAFKLAAAKAVHLGIKEAQPYLLEPIMEIEITIPEEYLGDINGDITSRRGHILGMDPVGPGRQRIRVQVPEGEILRYSTDLRSMTQGRGTFSIRFDHYDEVPDHVAKQVAAEYKASREAEH